MNENKIINQQINLAEQLKQLVAEQINVEKQQLKSDVMITNYGVSSLSSVMILQALNSTFNLDLDLETLLANFSINRLVSLISKQRNMIDT